MTTTAPASPGIVERLVLTLDAAIICLRNRDQNEREAQVIEAGKIVLAEAARLTAPTEGETIETEEELVALTQACEDVIAQGRGDEDVPVTASEMMRFLGDHAREKAGRLAAEARANDGDALTDGRLRDAEATIERLEAALRAIKYDAADYDAIAVIVDAALSLEPRP
jgi:hypothetical protein